MRSPGSAREGHGARALIVGAGPEEARLRDHARDLGLEGLIEWRSSVAYGEMPSVFAKASCFVLASLPTAWWEEQFGMVLAEAAAAGLPIVAADSGAIAEVLRGAGTLFPAGDWLALARALGEVLAAPPERRRPAALVTAYSIEAAAERYAAAYERVLELAVDGLGASRSLVPGEELCAREPAFAPRSGVGEQVEDCSGDRVRIERVEEERRVSYDLGQRAAVRRSDGATAGHRFERRQPEALVERREDERRQLAASGRPPRAREGVRAPRPRPAARRSPRRR